MGHYFKRNTCRLCDKSDLEPIMKLVPTPIGDEYVSKEKMNEVQNEYPLEVFFCNSCGQLQLIHVVNPENIYSEYMYETSISLGLTNHFKRYADYILHRLDLLKGSLVVDIGCNDGTFLKFFKNQDMRVLGVEPAHEIAKKNTEADIETLPTFFSYDLSCKIKEEYGAASVISTNNVLANIDDLNDVIKGIHELLAPDGVYFLEFQYVAELIQNSVVDNIYHEHLCYFSIKPFIRFLDKHGLELIETEQIATKGGSLRCMIQLIGGPRLVTSSVAEQVDYETEHGFDRIDIYKAFAEKMDLVKNRLRTSLLNLKSEGKTIAGYGASVGVTTLLYYWGLGDILDCLFDDNPSKHHMLSPGHHLPVLPSDEIYDRNPDYILILAWRYASPIMKKHPKYPEQGGRFIIPLPEVQVI